MKFRKKVVAYTGGIFDMSEHGSAVKIKYTKILYSTEINSII